MPVVYTLAATACPAIPVAAALTPGTDLPVRAEALVSSGSVIISEPWNKNAAHQDNAGAFGGARAHAVLYGLDLSDGGGLVANISAGAASVGAVPTVYAGGTKALSNGENYLWILRGGTIPSPQLNTTAPPAGAVAYLGRVTAAGGVITAIDYSGRVELRGGSLYRRTGDAAEPGDAPPAGLLIFTRTAGGYYLWTGDEYLAVPDLDAAQTWAQKQTFGGEVEIDGALNHDGATVGFRGAAPVAMPAALVQTYATADRTLGAYTPDDESAAYTGIDNAQAGTVYATLADLNALRAAYENLRAFLEDLAQHHNALVDDLQANGLEQ
jgi:hypothetical protein